ncbi:universal stress protein [Anaerosphaera multitolerans]|nr:universal stress protein [Anaerosphaera multitolerans]
MKNMKILIPVDGSGISEEIIETARIIGEKYNSELYILNVVDEMDVNFVHTNSKAFNSSIKELQLMLNDFKNKLGYPYSVKTFIKKGTPYKEIIKLAEEEDVDLIVMGNRGLGAFSRTMLGSVSHKVLNHTSKSVLIVKVM